MLKSCEQHARRRIFSIFLLDLTNIYDVPRIYQQNYLKTETMVLMEDVIVAPLMEGPDPSSAQEALLHPTDGGSRRRPSTLAVTFLSMVIFTANSELLQSLATSIGHISPLFVAFCCHIGGILFIVPVLVRKNASCDLLSRWRFWAHSVVVSFALMQADYCFISATTYVSTSTTIAFFQVNVVLCVLFELWVWKVDLGEEQQHGSTTAPFGGGSTSLERIAAPGWKRKLGGSLLCLFGAFLIPVGQGGFGHYAGSSVELRGCGLAMLAALGQAALECYISFALDDYRTTGGGLANFAACLALSVAVVHLLLVFPLIVVISSWGGGPRLHFPATEIAWGCQATSAFLAFAVQYCWFYVLGRPVRPGEGGDYIAGAKSKGSSVSSGRTTSGIVVVTPGLLSLTMALSIPLGVVFDFLLYGKTPPLLAAVGEVLIVVSFVVVFHQGPRLQDCS